MSIKKRFTIAPDLAKGLRSTIQSASTNHGSLHYDMMPLDLIELDPENPRKLSVSTEDIVKGINQSHVNYAIKLKELEDLQELAESIKRIGIRNAIEVYKEDQQYRIISGARRFLAALLAGQKSVPVRITQKPDEFNLRYTQWVENINRQDLSLWEKLNNLLSIAAAFKKSNQTEFSEKHLQNLLGISDIQTYRYFCLLKADKQVVEFIQQGKLNNLKVVQELVSLKDKIVYKQIVAWIASSKKELTSLASYKAAAGKKKLPTNYANLKPISLGKVPNKYIAKYLFEVALSTPNLNKYRYNFKNIDWSSSRSISKAFKELFKAIEKELCLEEEIA